MASPSLLDQQCQLKEICNHARTAKWYELGIQLDLKDEDVDIIKNDPAHTDKLTAMYKLWINKKGRDATHRKLINALKTDHVQGTNVGQKYEEWLKSKVARNEGIEQTINSADSTHVSGPTKDKSEHGSVTQSGHHQVIISGSSVGGGITIQMGGQGNVSKEDVYECNLPDHILDQQPEILELMKHASTAAWNPLGVQLQLNSVDLAGCHDCTSMYQLWLMEKAREATRRNLLTALHARNLNGIIQKYENYLKKII